MTKTRTEKVKRNVATSVCLQILKIVLSFVGRMIFAKMLGATYLGINGLFSNILTVLSVADLGMTAAMMYSLYKPLADGDNEKVSAYVKFYGNIYNVIAIVVAVLGVAVMPFLHFIVNLPEEIGGIYYYYLLMLTNLVISYLFLSRITLLHADQKSYVVNCIDMGQQCLVFLAQILVLIFAKSFILYLIVAIAGTFAADIIKSKIAKNKYYVVSDNIKIGKVEKRELARNIKDVFLYRFGGVIQSNTDNILTSVFVGTVAVGYFSNYTMVVLAITGLANMVFMALKSSIGNYNVKTSIVEQEKMFYVFEDYNYLLIAFCSVCFYVLFPDFITICFGKEYLLEPITVIFIILNFYTSNIRQNLWVYRETTGLFSKVKYVTFVTAIINLFLSIIGGYFFGITGIVGATVISRMLYAWWKEPVVIFRDYFKTSPKNYFLGYLMKIGYACAIAYALSIVSQFIVFDNIVVQGFARAFVTIILATIAICIPLKNREAMRILKKELRLKKWLRR